MSHNNNQWNHNRNTRNSGGGQGGGDGAGGGSGGNGPGGGNRNWNSGGRFNSGRERRPFRGGYGRGRNDGGGHRGGGGHFNQWNRNGGGGMGGPDGNYQRHPNQNNWQQQGKQGMKQQGIEIPHALTVPPPMLPLSQIAPSLIMDFDAPDLDPPPDNGTTTQSANIVAQAGNNSPEGFRGFSETEPASNGSGVGKHDDLTPDGNELFKLIEDEALKMITEQPSCSGTSAPSATPSTSAVGAGSSSATSAAQIQERRATFERSADQVTRKLINQLTTMNKYNLKQMINNPDSKYESALKTHARQKLRAEVRRQLRNFNLSDGASAQTKASICGMLEPDECVDSDKIPDALLEQIGKVLDLNLLHLDVNETDPPATPAVPGGTAPAEEDVINASDVDASATEVLDKNLGLTDDEGTLQLDAEDIFARAELLLMKGSETTLQGNPSGPSSPTEEMFPNEQIESIVSEDNGPDKIETIVIDSDDDDDMPAAKPSAESVLSEKHIKDEPMDQEEVADKNASAVPEETSLAEMEVAAEVQIEDIPVPPVEPIAEEVQTEKETHETQQPAANDKVSEELPPVQSQASVEQDKEQTEDDEQQSDILELHDSQVELLEEVVEFDKDQIVQQEEVVEHEEVVQEDKEETGKEQKKNVFEESDEIVLSKQSDFEEPDEEDEERNKFAAPVKHKVKEKKSPPPSPDKLEETTGCLSDAMACVFPCLLRVNTVEELNKKATNLPVVTRVRNSDDDEPRRTMTKVRSSDDDESKVTLREKKFEEPPKKPLKKPIIDITDLKIPDVDFSGDPPETPASETLETPSDIIRVPSFAELTVRRSKNPRTYKPNLVHHEQPKRDNKSSSASPTHSTTSTTSSKSHDPNSIEFNPLRAKLGLLLNSSTNNNTTNSITTQRVSRKSEHALRTSRSCGNIGSKGEENGNTGNDDGSSPQIDLPESKETRKPRPHTPGPKHAAEQLTERKKKKHSKRRPYSPSDEVDPDILRKTPSPASSRESSPARKDVDSAQVASRSARAKSVDPKLFCPDKKEKKLRVKQRSKSRSGRDPDEIRREKIKEEIRQLEKEILEEREQEKELTMQQERELLLEKEQEFEQALARERALAIEKERELELAKERERQRMMEIAREKERQRQLELAKEKERLRQLELERERVAAELAKEKEKQRLLDLAREKERRAAELLAREKEKELELARQKEQEKQLAKERELELAREKERAAELAREKEREKQLAKEKARKGKEVEKDTPDASETTPAQTKEQSARERKRRQSTKSTSKVVEETPKRSKSVSEIAKDPSTKEVSKKDGKKETEANLEIKKKDSKSGSKTNETNGVVAEKSSKEVGKEKETKDSLKKEKQRKEISKEPESSPEKSVETVEEPADKPRKRKKSLLRGPDLVKGRKEVEVVAGEEEEPETNEAIEQALESSSEVSVTECSTNQVLAQSISRAERSLTHRTASPRPWKSPGEKKQLPATPLVTAAAAPVLTVTATPAPVEQPTVPPVAATTSTTPVYSSLASIVTDAVRNNPAQADMVRISIPSNLVPESSLFAPVMGLLNQMQEIDNKMSEFQHRKMQIDSEMLKLNSEKFQIDQLSMQLQNERFMVLNAMRAAILECELTSLATAQSARRRHMESDHSSSQRNKRRKSMPAPAVVETSPRPPHVVTSNPDLSEAESDLPPTPTTSNTSGGERTIRKITKISGNTQILKLFQRRRLISEKSAEEDQSDVEIAVTTPTPEQPSTSKRRRTRTINVTTTTEKTAEPSPAVTVASVVQEPTTPIPSGRQRQQKDSLQSESSESIGAVQPAAEQPSPTPSVTSVVSVEASAPVAKTSPQVPAAATQVAAVTTPDANSTTTTTTTTTSATSAPPPSKKSRREHPPPRSVLTREVKIVLNKLNVKKRS